jgi:hypothetical protein
LPFSLASKASARVLAVSLMQLLCLVFIISCKEISKLSTLNKSSFVDIKYHPIAFSSTSAFRASYHSHLLSTARTILRVISGTN